MQFVLQMAHPVLNISAAVLLIVGFVAYLYFTRNGFADPNPFTWASLVFVSAACDHRLFGAIAVAVLVHAYLSHMLSSSRTRADWPVLAYCFAACVASFALRDEIGAFRLQSLVLMGAGIAFYPTVADTIRHPYSEQPFAWFAWAGAFGMKALDGHLQDAGFFAVMQPLIIAVMCSYTASLALREGKFDRARLLQL